MGMCRRQELQLRERSQSYTRTTLGFSVGINVAPTYSLATLWKSIRYREYLDPWTDATKFVLGMLDGSFVDPVAKKPTDRSGIEE